jgi:hypothetical protein
VSPGARRRDPAWRAFAGALAFLAAPPAHAHERWADGSLVPPWVKAACCGPSDVHHLTADQVHLDGDRHVYRIDGYPYPIPTEKLLPSQDGDWWVFYEPAGVHCDHEGGGCHEDGPGPVFCFFGPLGM